MMKASFKFHPVGQGCFYTGTIYSFKHAEFNIVYDCGSLSSRSYLNSEICYYKLGLSNKHIDILFLSHLDEDHVNGVKDLLTNITCKRIYLPYLTPIERLFLALKHTRAANLNQTEYSQFLISPHEYLQSIEGHQETEIIYIIGNNEKDLTEFDFPNSDNFTNEPLEIDDGELTESAENQIPDELHNLNAASTIKIKKANGRIVLQKVWEFYLYHEQTKKDFIKELQTATSGIKVDNALTQDNLSKILTDSDALKNLRKTFKKHLNNLNTNGLVVLHKPIKYKRAYFEPRVHHRYHWSYLPKLFFLGSLGRYPNYRKKDRFKWGATVLTGDIRLDQILNSKYIQSHLKHTFIFQIPHHGSTTGWNHGNNDQYLDELNQNGRTIVSINFGYGNKFGHPKPEVLEDLLVRNFTISFCNQFQFLSYNFDLKLT